DYHGDNRLLVTLQNRRIEMAVRHMLGSSRRLARGVVGFLKGTLPPLRASQYRVPLSLLLLALLPLGLVFVQPGSLGWLLAGLGVAALGALVAWQHGWGVPQRVILQLSLVSASIVAGLIGKFGMPFWTPSPIRNWQYFNPPNSLCRVLMPGQPEQ